jgi:myo-inositol-1(or 4)-monophosphatase
VSRSVSAPAAKAAAEAVATGRYPGEQHQNRRDDRDDGRKTKRYTERVHQSRKKHGDQNSNHVQPLSRRFDGTSIFPRATTTQSDLSIAVAAVHAAAEAAIHARSAPLRPRAKSVAADLVTDADAQAERAAADIIRTHCPDDAIVGEEGTSTNETSTRRWYIDGIDGTVSFASQIAGGWCTAVALTDAHGAKTAAVYAPEDGLYTAERGQGAERDGKAIAVRPARPLDDAHVASFFRRDRLVNPGVRELAHTLLDRAGLLRHAGPGTLELAWIAAGRLDAWIQPDTDPWDWLPGALLVTEAGGAAQITGRWHIAGPARLVDELVSLVT